jgi:hypothetical protein
MPGGVFGFFRLAVTGVNQGIKVAHFSEPQQEDEQRVVLALMTRCRHLRVALVCRRIA